MAAVARVWDLLKGQIWGCGALDQQPWHHPAAGGTCGLSGPILDILKQDLHFHNPPGDLWAHPSLRSSTPRGPCSSETPGLAGQMLHVQSPSPYAHTHIHEHTYTQARVHTHAHTCKHPTLRQGLPQAPRRTPLFTTWAGLVPQQPQPVLYRTPYRKFHSPARTGCVCEPRGTASGHLGQLGGRTVWSRVCPESQPHRLLAHSRWAVKTGPSEAAF